MSNVHSGQVLKAEIHPPHGRQDGTNAMPMDLIAAFATAYLIEYVDADAALTVDTSAGDDLETWTFNAIRFSVNTAGGSAQSYLDVNMAAAQPVITYGDSGRQTRHLFEMDGTDTTAFLIQGALGRDFFLINTTTPAISIGNTSDNPEWNWLGSGEMNDSTGSPGAATNVWTSNGAGVAPSWTAAAAGAFPHVLTDNTAAQAAVTDGTNNIAVWDTTDGAESLTIGTTVAGHTYQIEIATPASQPGILSFTEQEFSIGGATGAHGDIGTDSMALGFDATCPDLSLRDVVIGHTASAAISVVDSVIIGSTAAGATGGSTSNVIGATTSAGSGATNILGFASTVGTSANGNNVIGASITVGNSSANNFFAGQSNTIGTSSSNNVIISNGLTPANGMAENVWIGMTGTENGLHQRTVAIGRGFIIDSGVDDSIGLGHDVNLTADFQFVVGSIVSGITEMYIGEGVVSTFPGTEIAINATGGSGTDIAGTDLALNGGRPTGDAIGGSLILATAPGTVTGTTLRPLITRCDIDEDGSWAITLPAGETVTMALPSGNNNPALFLDNAAGDAYVRYQRAADSWVMGLDNTTFVLAHSSSPGTNRIWTVDTSNNFAVIGVNIDLDPTGTFTLDMDAAQVCTITVADNLNEAFLIQEGTNNYIEVQTVDGTERVVWGNTTTNPNFQFLGTGTLDFDAGAIDLDPTGAFTLNMDAAQDITITPSSTSSFIIAAGTNDASAFRVNDGADEILTADTAASPTTIVLGTGAISETRIHGDRIHLNTHSTATNTGELNMIDNGVSTTDATLTTILTLPTSTGNRGSVWVQGCANDSTNTTGTSFVLQVAWSNVAGTVTVHAATQHHAVNNPNAIPGFSAVGSGANILVQVTGLAVTNINWQAHSALIETA